MDVLSTFGLFVVQLHLVQSECGPAPVVQNGTAEGTGFQHGNSRKYTCDLGFRLSDFDTSICTSEDEWSPAPSCRRISCGNPPAVANSHISRKTGARYTDQQTYACNSGYILNGTATIICGVNGWSEPLPVCDKISCSTPPSILNGQFILNSTLYLDIVNYTCDNGYELGEVTEITCQADGSWSTLPSCDRVSCGSAPVLQNGIIDVSIGTLYTDTVKYMCDLGYIINGQDTVTCQGDKSWTIMPTCDIRQCGTPPAVQNADWTNTGISYLDEATYTCKTGYEFSDSESRITITCLHTGSWETEPSCSVVDCGEPPSIVNADVSGTGTVYQATRQIECHSGFITHGIAFVMCTSNSSWSTSPVCYKQCLSEPSVTNATSTGSGMEYLDIRTFQCSYGYIMTGMPTVSCQEDGTWTTLPICKIVRCGTPKAITDGTLSGTGTDYGDVRIVSCNTGYSLTGNTSITCEATGIWTVLPTCSRKDCGAPPTVSNSLYNVSGTFYGDNLKFVCDEGYNLIGADTVMCDADAEWTATPTCQKKRLW